MSGSGTALGVMGPACARSQRSRSDRRARPLSATTLARSLPCANVPAPNILSAKHLARIRGGLLFAANANVPWAALLARTFERNVTTCASCGGRAVVTEHAGARDILEALPGPSARAPPTEDVTYDFDLALA